MTLVTSELFHSVKIVLRSNSRVPECYFTVLDSPKRHKLGQLNVMFFVHHESVVGVTYERNK